MKDKLKILLMTPAELNERAARLCGLKISESMLRAGQVVRIGPRGGWKKWSPATDPADCAVVKRVMREKGWRLSVIDCGERRGWAATYSTSPTNRIPRELTYAPTEEHAVTLAAVMATTSPGAQ